MAKDHEIANWDSEMWEWTESVALVLHPVHQVLLNMAAKGDVIHNDDTTGKILELMEENRQAELAKRTLIRQAKRQISIGKGFLQRRFCQNLRGIRLQFT